jgi:hypothetical protein
MFQREEGVNRNGGQGRGEGRGEGRRRWAAREERKTVNKVMKIIIDF